MQEQSYTQLGLSTLEARNKKAAPYYRRVGGVKKTNKKVNPIFTEIKLINVKGN